MPMQLKTSTTTLLTPEQTAAMLMVRTDTLAVWRSTKRYDLPYVKVGRLVRYKLTDIEAFLNASVTIH
jgi:hypothetical protein